MARRDWLQLYNKSTTSLHVEMLWMDLLYSLLYNKSV